MLRLDINLLFTVINVLILYFLLRRFLFGRVDKILAQRQQMVDEQLRQAEQEKAQAQALRAEYEGSIDKARQEGEKLLSQAQEKAQEAYGRIVKTADEEAEKTMAQARAQIRTEREHALRELSGEISALAMDAAEKVVGEKASPERDRALYDQFLRESGAEA